jgi:lysophospholipase L1-like esterase
MKRISILANCLLVAVILFLIFRYQIPPRLFRGNVSIDAENHPPAWLIRKETCSYQLSSFDFHYKNEVENPAIIMFGNSIVRRADWQDLLDRKDVINRGISGDKTYCMCQRLSYLKGKRAKIWFIEGGINDLPQATTDSIVNQYNKIVSFVRSEGAVPVINLVFYTTPIRWSAAFKKTRFPALNDSIAVLNKKLTKYAAEQKIDVIDLNSVISPNHVMEAQFTVDGIHLSGKGYLEWTKMINSQLNKYNI